MKPAVGHGRVRLRLGTLARTGAVAWAMAAAAAAGGCASAPVPITKLVGGKQVHTRPVSPDAYEHVTRALVYETENRWADAAAELRSALVYDRDAPELHARLAEDLIRENALDEAEAAVRASLAIETTADGLVAEAHVRQARGDATGAVVSLTRAAKLVSFAETPADAESAALELADAQILALQVKEAHATLQVFCVLAPRVAAPRVRLAATAWALGDFALAAKRAHEAVALDPNQVDALLLSAWLNVAEGRDADARADFTAALDRSEGSLEIATAYARYLVAAGNQAAASQVADDLGASDAAAQSLPSRIELERAAGRPEKALALVAQAAAAQAGEDDSGLLMLARAQILDSQEKSSEAVAVYLSIPKTSDSFNESRLRAAALLHDQAKIGAAALALGEISTDNQSLRLELDLALALSSLDEKQGDPDRGVARLNTTLAKHPGEARLLLARAGIEDRRGQWQAALATAQTVLSRQPGSVEALNFWGFVAADHGIKLPLAQQRLTAALALEPGSGAVLDSLGWAYFRAGDIPHAALFLQQAGRLDPADPEILGHLAELDVHRNQPAAAAERLRRALSTKASMDEAVKKRLKEQLHKLGAPRGVIP